MDRIEIALNAFHEAMLAKFRRKELAGFTGWDDITMKEYLEQELSTHVIRIEYPDDLVDVALVAAFLWFMKVGGRCVFSKEGKDITNRVGKMTIQEASRAGIDYKTHPYMLDPEEGRLIDD